MGIPESQLDTWSHQGSVTQSSDTYNTIKKVLEAGTPYAARDFTVFLQGSYGNDTNIWSESDVDVVIQLNEIFLSDLSTLSEVEKAAFASVFPSATYSFADFKRDVLQVLGDKYGDDITPGDKAIIVAASGNRRKADVIVAIQYRRYYKFNGILDQSYDEGICFWNAKGDMIANYPRQHCANLTSKHQGTGAWLKPMVRILKNLRSRCITDGLLTSGVAPSYYLEGLLYNVPAEKFGTNYAQSFANAINWIQTEADKDKLVCANGQYYLLRDNSHTCWSKGDAEQFLTAAIKLWNDW